MDIDWPEDSSDRKALVLVEGPTDQLVVRIILDLLQYPGRIDVQSMRGIPRIRERLKQLEAFRDYQSDGSDSRPVVVALIDADELSVPDAIAHARQRLGNPSVPVFCAVPTLESWLFADPVSAEKVALPRYKRIVGRIVAPDSIPQPKQLAEDAFGTANARRPFFLAGIDLKLAISRSPSLASFVGGVVQALGGDSDLALKAIGTQVNRTIFANLLRELPAKTVGWRTMEGEYSAEELADRVLNGEPLGIQYVTSLLRLARDILAARTLEDE